MPKNQLKIDMTIAREEIDHVEHNEVNYEAFMEMMGEQFNWMGTNKDSIIDRIIGFNMAAGKETGVVRDLTDPKVRGAIDLVDEEYKELKTGLNNSSREEVVDALGDLIVVCAGAIFDLGHDANEVMHRICNANESKFCLTEEAAKASVEAYSDSTRYSDVTYEQRELFGTSYYVILGKTEKGKTKILKPHDWVAPDYSDIL